MWTRRELKDKAKVSFKANYWKAVFAALILGAVASGLALISYADDTPSFSTSTYSTDSASLEEDDGYSRDNVNVQMKDGHLIVDVDDSEDSVHVDFDGANLVGSEGTMNIDGESIDDAEPFIVLGAAFMGFILLLVVALFVALDVFLFSPLEVGASRFFLRNLNQRAEVKELAFAYDANYKETVKTLFLRSVFIFLWTLLLIIPGIYKTYEYRMIPYLLADDPTMTKDRAFAESKRLMDGQKWNAFVLDLSFIGWLLLSTITLGIVGVFYVDPYRQQTNAALYEKLRYGMTSSASPVQPAASAYTTQPQHVAGAQLPVVPFAANDPEPSEEQACEQPCDDQEGASDRQKRPADDDTPSSPDV